MISAKQNPYVGPRTFRTDEGHLFFGREREALNLLSLVISERLVLFYAQSGAGKSSLVNTRLIPGLKAEGEYEVLAIGRVRGEREGLGQRNIYIFNLISSLAQHSFDDYQLSQLTLSEFLSKLDFNKDGYFYNENASREPQSYDDSPVKKLVLIIDQFEELFTTHEEAWEKREDFFRQLAQAMQDIPHLWVVLVMREDYIAYLDPYVYLLPGRLRVRYYMQRLGPDSALEAITNPVRSIRPYAEGVAEALVENLALIKVQRPDGRQVVQPGQFVEPVQLQVVCHNLWEHLSEGAQITERDLQDVGDVDLALERYYDQRVSAVAKDKRVSERFIREWFGKALITSSGTRNMVLRDSDSVTRLHDNVIQAFLGDLVRAELRAGQLWYELSHDRLIEPVRHSNARWFETHLSLFQRQVVLWLQQDRSESLLLRGRELEVAEKEAAMLNLTNEEQDFLEACYNLRRREERDQTQRRVIVSALIASIILLFIAVFSTYKANEATRVAKEQAQRATTFLTLALAKSQTFPLSVLLTSEVYRQLENYQTLGALLDITQASPHLRQMLFGHNDLVLSVAFSPDGKILASGSADKTIILWDVASHKQIGEPLQGHGSSVHSVVFSPNGEILVSGSDDNTIILWDMTSDAPVRQKLEGAGHTDAVYSVAFSPDGKILASGSWDDSIIFWDVATRRPIGKPLVGHEDNVHGVAFSPDGKILASGGQDHTIMFWDVVTHQSITQLPLPNDSDVEGVTFSGDGQILAAGSVDGTITLWDVGTQQVIDVLKEHENGVWDLAFSPDGKSLASASGDGAIILWDVAARQAKEEPLTGHNGSVYDVSFSPDGNTLASAGLDNSVVLWDVLPRRQISQILTGHQARINSVTFSPDGKTFASGSDDSSFILWDVSGQQPTGLLHSEVGHWIRAAAFSPDGNLLALGSYSAGTVLLDIASGTSSSLLSARANPYEYVFSVAFSPDGKTLAAGNWENTIVLWDVATLQQIDELTAHQPRSEAGRPAVTSLAFSPDGKILASGSEDKTIILWDTATYQPVDKLEGHMGAVNWVTFNPDGKVLASAGSDGSIILWDMETHRMIQQLSGQSSGLRTVAFNPNGTILAAGGMDRSIFLWDVALGQPIGQPLAGHTSVIYSLVFTPDGKTLVSAGKEIILWDFDPDSWLEKNCRRAGRNLTREEWIQYFPGTNYRATCPQWPSPLPSRK